MKQSGWKERVESIKAEMLRRGKEKGASEILKQFSTRLSATVLHFFAESDSFSPNATLTVDQKAFTHSLQLYDFNSVMRLVVNYDVTKGLKVLIPGIEKSYRSLMVVPQLERFINNSLESTALGVYKFRLEDALSSFLRCRRSDLYEEDALNGKMAKVSSIPKELREKFFTERLRTLFSSNYRTYLMLKNRYFLNRLFHYKNNNKNSKIHVDNNKKFSSKINIFEINSIENMEEKLDFRSIEKLVKEQISQNDVKDKVFLGGKILTTLGNFKSDRKIQHKEKIKINEKIYPKKNESPEKVIQPNSLRKGNIEEVTSSYLQLFSKYSKPLKDMMDSFCSVPECSSPYFRPRAEDYRIEFSNFFKQIHGGNLHVTKAIHNFTLELLLKYGHEYNASERWGMVSKNTFNEKSIYFRSTEKVEKYLDRKTEWSILIQSLVPFQIKIPMENGKDIYVKRGKRCLFQIGTAFFDHGHQKKLEEFPDVFFKLMFGGHILTSKNAVIHVEEDPYFTTTLAQLWHCRGLIYLFLMAISKHFAIEHSLSLKEFLVEILPKTISVTGLFPSISSLPSFLKIFEGE